MEVTRARLMGRPLQGLSTTVTQSLSPTPPPSPLHPPTLLPAVITSHNPLLQSATPPRKKNKDSSSHSIRRERLPLPMFNLRSSFSLPSSSSSSNSSSSKQFWLFCFAALQRINAHDNNDGRLFSPRSHSPGLARWRSEAGFVLPCDIQALSIKNA